MAQKLTPIPETVKLIRKARQLTSAELAATTGITSDFLTSIERSPTSIPRGKAYALADALAVPIHYLFFRNLDIAPNLPDFRTVGNRPAILTSAGLARVQRARSIINYLNDSIFRSDLDTSLVGIADVKDGVASVAKILQKYYNPVHRADNSIDPVATFRKTRLEVEKDGAIVLCEKAGNDDFRGFCFSEKGRFPLIFINTYNQRPATKLFTLMHEIVHVLIGKTGVSDPGILENKVEQFCNKVTAAVMMPSAKFIAYYKKIINKSPRGIVSEIAHFFGVSKSAAAIRIGELGLDADFYKKWLAALPKKIPVFEEEDEGEKASGGGGIGAQIGRFGYRLPNVLGKAVKAHNISVFDAYRLTNLSPKTLTELSTIGQKQLEL